MCLYLSLVRPWVRRRIGKDFGERVEIAGCCEWSPFAVHKVVEKMAHPSKF